MDDDDLQDAVTDLTERMKAQGFSLFEIEMALRAAADTLNADQDDGPYESGVLYVGMYPS